MATFLVTIVFTRVCLCTCLYICILLKEKSDVLSLLALKMHYETCHPKRHKMSHDSSGADSHAAMCQPVIHSEISGYRGMMGGSVPQFFKCYTSNMETKSPNFLSDLSNHVLLDGAEMRHIRDADRSNTTQPTAGFTSVDLCVN